MTASIGAAQLLFVGGLIMSACQYFSGGVTTTSIEDDVIVYTNSFSCHALVTFPAMRCI